VCSKRRKHSDTYALNVLDYIYASALEGKEPSDLSANEYFAIEAHEIDIFLVSM
jgi:hypothetical protein